MAMKRWWVGRDTIPESEYVIFHGCKPSLRGEYYDDSKDSREVASFSEGDWDVLFELRIRPGQCVEIERPMLKKKRRLTDDR